MIDEQRQVFRAVLAGYYRSELTRAEKCLGDIIDMLGAQEVSETEQIEAVLTRLTQHYSRS